MLVCVCVIKRIKWIRLPSLRERKDWKGLVSMKISHRIPLLLKQLPILSTPPFYGKNLNPPFFFRKIPKTQPLPPL